MNPFFRSVIASGASAPTPDDSLFIPPNAIFAARSDGVTAVGSDATVWPDQSGAGNDATGVSITAYPQIDPSTFARPIIVATASQGYFTLPSGIAVSILKGNDLPWTIAGVAYTTNGDEITGFGGSPSSDPIIRIRHSSSNRLQASKEAGVASFANAHSTGVFTDNTLHAWCVRCNGTTADVWVNSTTVNNPGQSFNVDDCSGAATDGTIFRRPGATTQGQMMGALVICNAAESDPEIANIMNSMLYWRNLLAGL